jgi:hypothetical protein
MRFNQPFDKRKLKQKFRPLEDETMFLGIVTGSTAIESPNDQYMWEYTVARAKLNYTAGTYPTVTTRNEGSVTALSVSELGNSTNTFSYGVGLNGVAQFLTVPPTIFPVKIPTGTPVVVMAWRNYEDGQVIYLIINTQAISGTCE